MTFYFFLPISTREKSNLLNKINGNKLTYLAFFSRKRKLLQSDSEPSQYHSVLHDIWVLDTCFQDAIQQGITQSHWGSPSHKRLDQKNLLKIPSSLGSSVITGILFFPLLSNWVILVLFLLLNKFKSSTLDLYDSDQCRLNFFIK